MSDEPVAWMWNALRNGEVITQYGPYVPSVFKKSAVPLYLHPPEKTTQNDEPDTDSIDMQSRCRGDKE